MCESESRGLQFSKKGQRVRASGAEKSHLSDSSAQRQATDPTGQRGYTYSMGSFVSPVAAFGNRTKSSS